MGGVPATNDDHNDVYKISPENDHSRDSWWSFSGENFSWIEIIVYLKTTICDQLYKISPENDHGRNSWWSFSDEIFSWIEKNYQSVPYKRPCTTTCTKFRLKTTMVVDGHWSLDWSLAPLYCSVGFIPNSWVDIQYAFVLIASVVCIFCL